MIEERRSKRLKAEQAGLALPELLIALLIFSMISAAGVGALRIAIEAREQFEAADDALRQWQSFDAVVKDDLTNLAPRVARDEFGDPAPAAFVGGRALELITVGRNGETPLFAFVRGGRENPGYREPRSNLQHVEYVLRGDAIFRRARPYVDDAPNAAETERRVLYGLAGGARASFLFGQNSRGLEWVDTWPGGGGAAAPPRALRLSTSTARYGSLELLFWIGDVGR